MKNCRKRTIEKIAELQEDDSQYREEMFEAWIERITAEAEAFFIEREAEDKTIAFDAFCDWLSKKEPFRFIDYDMWVNEKIADMCDYDEYMNTRR